MADLRALQAHFWRRITAADSADARAAAEALVGGDERGSAAERMGVYADMYEGRLRDVVALDYPKLVTLLGEERFDDLFSAYLRACPSEHPSVRFVGARLPEFLATHPLGQERPWLAELARLEWARGDLFDRADEAPLTVDEVRALGAEGLGALVLRLIAAHELVPVTAAVDEVWRVLDGGATCVAPPGKAPGAILVWRQDEQVRHRRIGRIEEEALRFLAPRPPFAALGERLLEGREEAEAAQLAWELFTGWLTSGLLVSPQEP